MNNSLVTEVVLSIHSGSVNTLLRKMKLGCWRKEGDIQMNSTLKTIEIRHSVGSEDEVELLQILLEKSTVLERVIISISESLAQDTVELEEFHEKLLKCC
ncbi:hypothetical protein ACHQM5_024614 [Ranunculus cassubicifolius]